MSGSASVCGSLGRRPTQHGLQLLKKAACFVLIARVCPTWASTFEKEACLLLIVEACPACAATSYVDLVSPSSMEYSFWKTILMLSCTFGGVVFIVSLPNVATSLNGRWFLKWFKKKTLVHCGRSLLSNHKFSGHFGRYPFGGQLVK